MIVDIKGESIELISFDFAITLRTDRGTELRLETGVELQLPKEDVLWVGPPRFDGADQLIRTLLHRRIEMVEIDPEGVLHLRLENKVQIVVPPSLEYESWTLNRSDGTLLTSAPDGEVISWGPSQLE